MFHERTLTIATKHKKEIVIAPIVESSLGVRCEVPSDFDSDLLGTFSGEVARFNDPLTTARTKINMAINNNDLAIASEGSFGPHPQLFFMAANEEILVFIDKKNGLEIVARELTTETNFNASEIRNEKELESFATKSLFPTHGLIIRKNQNDYTEIFKGITTHNQLQSTMEYFFTKYGKAYVETDMRAMYNPTRMKVIEKTCLQLVDKINTLCPHCQTPGFGISKIIKGLPCELCKLPTNSALSYIHSCQKCSFIKEEKYPDDKLFEDPRWCDICNP